MDRIINPCEAVAIGEQEYAINTDFSVWIEIGELFLQKKAIDVVAAKILRLAYPVLPLSPKEAFEKIMWFYAGGVEPAEIGKPVSVPTAPVFDFKKDFPYIWAAFLGEFGIDLSAQKLHWWKFRSLLMALGDENRFSRIISYRTVNLSDVKDRNVRAFYEKMKNKYRLDDCRTSEERELETALIMESLF